MDPAGGAQMPLDMSPEELESMRSEAERLLQEHTRPGLRPPACKLPQDIHIVYI